MKHKDPALLSLEISYTAKSGLKAGYMQLLTLEELERKIGWLKGQEVTDLKIYNGSKRLYPKSKPKQA